MDYQCHIATAFMLGGPATTPGAISAGGLRPLSTFAYRYSEDLHEVRVREEVGCPAEDIIFDPNIIKNTLKESLK